MKASELRPGIEVVLTNKRLPQESHPVLVAGGLAIYADGEWLSLQDKPHRKIEWEVLWWAEIPNSVMPPSLAVAGWDDEPCEPKEYRCFHCGEVFNAESAAEHFGQMVTFPACTIDVAAYRAMEEECRQYREEDTDLHKQIHALNAEMYEKVRRAEEDGYARGLRDAKAHPEELGLQAVEPAPSTPEPPTIVRRYVHGNHEKCSVLTLSDMPVYIEIVGRKHTRRYSIHEINRDEIHLLRESTPEPQPFEDGSTVRCISIAPEVNILGELVDVCRCTPPYTYVVEKCVNSPVGWLVSIIGELHEAKHFIKHKPITSTNVLTGEKTQWEFATPELQEQFVKDAITPDPQPFKPGDLVVCEDGVDFICEEVKPGVVYEVEWAVETHLRPELLACEQRVAELERMLELAKRYIYLDKDGIEVFAKVQEALNK